MARSGAFPIPEKLSDELFRPKHLWEVRIYAGQYSAPSHTQSNAHVTRLSWAIGALLLLLLLQVGSQQHCQHGQPAVQAIALHAEEQPDGSRPIHDEHHRQSRPGEAEAQRAHHTGEKLGYQRRPNSSICRYHSLASCMKGGRYNSVRLCCPPLYTAGLH